jgi:hypothetical protein
LPNFDAGHGPEQTQMALWHPVRIGHSVAAQTLAQILCFANVKNRIPNVAHEINSGTLRQVTEEISPQPLDQRLRIREEELLRRWHVEFKAEA